MLHPVPARLKAFAFYAIDFGGQVAQHVAQCEVCALVLLEQQIRASDVSRKRRDDREYPDSLSPKL